MKRQLTFAIFAVLITAIFSVNASAQFGDLMNKVSGKIDRVKQEVEAAKKAKKDLERLANSGANKETKNQPSKNQSSNNAASWVTFSKSHTQSSEARNASLNTLGCGDGIFATINYREPVDNSGGYTVSMLVDGAVVAKQQMSGGSETSVSQTIHIELIPAEDADNSYPKVTFAKAKTILGKLQPANHTVQITVSLNNNPKNIAVGEFEYTGGAGCDAKDQRKPKTPKDTAQTQQQPTESQKPAMVEIELQGSCGESARLVTIDGGPYDRRSVYVKNGSTREQAVVGAQIFLKADFGTDTTLIYTVGSASSQIVKVCQ